MANAQETRLHCHLERVMDTSTYDTSLEPYRRVNKVAQWALEHGIGLPGGHYPGGHRSTAVYPEGRFPGDRLTSTTHEQTHKAQLSTASVRLGLPSIEARKIMPASIGNRVGVSTERSGGPHRPFGRSSQNVGLPESGSISRLARSLCTRDPRHVGSFRRVDGRHRP